MKFLKKFLVCLAVTKFLYADVYTLELSAGGENLKQIRKGLHVVHHEFQDLSKFEDFKSGLLDLTLKDQKGREVQSYLNQELEKLTEGYSVVKYSTRVVLNMNRSLVGLPLFYFQCRIKIENGKGEGVESDFAKIKSQYEFARLTKGFNQSLFRELNISESSYKISTLEMGLKSELPQVELKVKDLYAQMRRCSVFDMIENGRLIIGLKGDDSKKLNLNFEDKVTNLAGDSYKVVSNSSHLILHLLPSVPYLESFVYRCHFENVEEVEGGFDLRGYCREFRPGYIQVSQGQYL